MRFQKSLVSIGIAGALALGMSSHAYAGVYAGSRLDIQGLNISFTAPGGIEPGAVTGYTFVSAANATLNGASGNQNSECGTVAGPACSNVAPVLQATANAPGGAPVRSAGDFTFFGPGVNQTYSNSASQIGDATLSTGNPTNATQISEVEIAGTGTGNSDTKVTSTTAFNFVFTVGTDNATFDISFFANPNLFSSVNTPGLISDAAQSSVSVSFNLSGSHNTQVSWAPNGAVGGVPVSDCDSSAGLTCTEVSDTQSLNLTRILGPGNPNSNGYSDTRTGGVDAGLTYFEFKVEGLLAGTYSLGLTATTAAEAQQITVPEPGIVSLMGIGLIGMGYVGRRKSMESALSA
ncbi:PEP-CTERM sorting domain-containing protein [Methylomonas koyamae]|uniref:PEP-CTERM sorting domain-containing protein n=1 Tax=Methylomonas koyamae TaxID=702114 RepID=UPI002873122E|nr:PEP-CTERM sorting domain-containing protein [Methylomonas koyamae]WNB77253.1 PEP-CTERM sorting domain-containing protein [Methylomonas koyamae]